ncbi:acyl-CoA dehydrogenase family protein [Nonomuraea basaltis]|uniref:acyl-CoA dehydrogenase family protein n=1 Tax=Nonomuraea basaltis TaxID=2495887 RepID=UPI00110C669B|nr:acyl-CoA dehydrogenase family protein [Nonomuraea basaltis]TMR94035.1 acyl-CoA dehydrogenase [Nonomuraea basaltis]
MNFAFTDEQLALGATVRDVLRAHCPPAALRSERRPAWEQLAVLGFFGLLLPPESDGLGLGLADVLPALEETGRACLPGPVVETAVAAPYLPAGIPKLASGAVCVSVLLPGQVYAPDADLADLLVVAGADGLRLVAKESVRLTPRPGVDPCRPLFEVAFDESERLGGSAAPALRRVTVATAAQLIGVARELLAVSVAYARVRTQFGAPIGSFQAVKHQLADVAVAVEFAAPMVYRAALAVDGAAATVERDVSAAKVAAGEAATLAARVALQVHGAIGYTEELDLRFWLARAWSLSAAYGTTAAHRERLRTALLGGDLRRYP